MVISVYLIYRSIEFPEPVLESAHITSIETLFVPTPADVSVPVFECHAAAPVGMPSPLPKSSIEVPPPDRREFGARVDRLRDGMQFRAILTEPGPSRAPPCHHGNIDIQRRKL